MAENILTCPKHFGPPEEVSREDLYRGSHFCTILPGLITIFTSPADEIICLSQPVCNPNGIEYYGVVGSAKSSVAFPHGIVI
jgi:hypothetical protein